ncbi:MAG: SIMPL domain-containing protein [Cellvibrionaceae bacterium]
MKKILLMVLTLWPGIMVPAKVLANELPDFPFVSVVGEAEKSVEPDQVRVSLQALVFSDTSTQAVDQNRSAMNQVLRVLRDFDVDEESVEASDVRKREKRAKDDNYQSLRILGYEVSRSVSFQLKNLEHYSGLINALNSIDYITDVSSRFDTSERIDIETELLQEASRRSRKKADVLAAGLNSKIDSVFGISQDRDFHYGGASFRYRVGSVQAMMAPPSDSQAMTLFIPKSIQLSQHVSVLYRLK